MHMLDANEWGWKGRPATEADFEAMMASLDTYLAKHEVQPHQRAFAGKSLVARMLNISLPLAGSIFGIGADDMDPTVGRVSKWFNALYEKRFNRHFDSRSFVFDLRGTLWRMRVGVVFGTVELFLDKDWNNTGGVPIDRSLNLLHGIDDFTPAYAARLLHTDFDSMGAAFHLGIPAIEALDGFSKHTLFDLARLDYAHSVDALVSGIAWNKAWWETAQTAEKVMKGMLDMEKQKYPKGQDGHVIPKVGEAFGKYFVVSLPADLLQAIDCKPAVRYGDEEATRQNAFASHVALLRLLPILSKVYYSRPPHSA